MKRDEHDQTAERRLGLGLEDWLRSAPAEDDELDALFDLLDGRLSAEDEASLRRRIEVEPHLAEQWRTVQAEIEPWTEERAGIEPAQSFPQRSWLAVAAAALIAVTAFAWFALRIERPAGSAIADGANPADRIAASTTAGAFDPAVELQQLRTSARFHLPASLDPLRPPDGALRDGEAPYRTEPARPEPNSPVGTFTRASPTFRWSAVPNAQAYDVVVASLDFEEIAAVDGLRENSWRPDASTWPRGTPLTWQVTARLTDGRTVRAPVPPAAEARFALLDEASASALETRLEQIDLARRQDALSAAERGLLRAHALATSGLVDLAEAELAALDDTEDRALLGRLRASLRASVPRRDNP